MKLLLLLIVGGGIIFPMACAEGVRLAKALKKTGPSSSMSYASYYPTAAPSTIGENDNDYLFQQEQEGNNSNGVDDEDIEESIATQPTSTTSTAVDSETTQVVVTTISTVQSTSISKTDSGVGDTSSTLSTPSSTSSKKDETNTGTSCTLLVVDSEENVLSVMIPFYYQLETTTFDDEILTNIENSLLSGMCSVTESIRRLRDTDHQVFEWNSKPNDTVSVEYDCTPSSEGAQFCNVVEGGMTVHYDGDDDEAAIETHAYQQIEDQFSSLSVDDSRVVSVQYLGSSPPIETEDESVDTVKEEEIVSLSYVPSPFIITSSGILLFALMIGIYGVLMRGRRKGVSSSDNDTLPPPTTHEEVESIATKEDESQATTVLHANLDTSIPIVPRYSDNDDETMHTLKQIVLGEDEETRTEWERLGILPVVA